MSVRTSAGRRSAVAGLTSLALLAPVGWALLTGSPAPATRVALSSGAAWLLSPDKGYLTLIDGPSEQVVATVLAPSAGPGLSVTQDGPSAYLTDDTTGTVTRIDGATYLPAVAIEFGDPGSDLTVIAGGGAAFVVDASARLATVVEPQTLTTIRKVSLAAEPGDQQTLVSGDGRLWTVDGAGTGLSWVDPDGRTGSVPAEDTARLVAVDGRVAMIRTATEHPAVNWVGPDGSGDAWDCGLDARAGDDVQLLGSATDEQVFAAVGQSGTLLVVGDDPGTCGTVVQVGAPNSRFGGLVQNGQFVFVPDRTTGATVVVDLATATVVATLPLTEPGNDLELLSKDGVVFYNDLSSERAGVIQQGSDGGWVAGKALQKYDPATGEAENLVTETPDTPPVVEPTEPVVEPGVTPEEPTAPDDRASEPVGDDESSGVDPPAVTPPAVTPPVVTPPVVTPPVVTPPVVTPPVVTPPVVTPPVVTPPVVTPPGVTPPVTTVTSVTADTSPILAGLPATFRGTISGPDGGWTWRVLDGTTQITTDATSGAMTLTIPDTMAGRPLTVTLTVNGSAPRTETFTVQPQPTTTGAVTTTTIEVADEAYTGELVTFAVDVGAAGTTPTGTVELSYQADNGSNGSFGTGELTDGRVVYEAMSINDAGNYTFTAAYTPDAVTFQPSEGTAALVVRQTYSTSIAVTGVSGDNTTGRGFFTYPGGACGCISMTVRVTADVAVSAGDVELSYPTSGGGVDGQTIVVNSDGYATFVDVGGNALTGNTQFYFSYSGAPGFSTAGGDAFLQVDPAPVIGAMVCVVGDHLRSTITGMQAGWSVNVDLNNGGGNPVTPTDSVVLVLVAPNTYELSMSGFSDFLGGYISVSDDLAGGGARWTPARFDSAPFTGSACGPP